MQVRRLMFDTEVMRLMGMTVFIKPFGLVTQMLLASYFGAGVTLDAYVFALFLVEFFDGAAGNVHKAVIIPLTIKLKTRYDQRFIFEFQSAVFLLFLVPALVYMGFLIVKSNLVMDIVGPKLPQDTRNYVVDMLKIMALPGIALLSVTMLKATLNLNRRFRLPAAMPVVNGIVVLVILILFHDRLGIWVLPVGFAVSNISQLICLWFYALAKRCIGLVRPKILPGTLSQMWALGWMVLVAQTILKVNGFIDKMFAASLEPGSISSINYSMTIMNFGLQVFTFSLVAVMFTHMSEFFARDDMEGCSDYIHLNLKRVSRIVVPVSLALSLASAEIVQVLFQRGAFDAADASRTAGALAMYLLGLPAVIINALVARIFHSMQRMRDRMWLAAQFLLTNAVGNYLLIGSMKVTGLAIASSLAINLHLALALIVLHSYNSGLNTKGFFAVVGRAYILAGLAYVVYRLSGVGESLDAWDLGTTVPGALLIAVCRFCFIIAVYAIGHLVWRRYSARS